MAKTSKTNRRKQAQVDKQQTTPAEPSRRNVLKLVRNGAIGAVALGGAGYLGRGWFNEFLEEHDLTRLGQGKPAVVQVHDPTCPICTALQGETRAAMKQFGECDLLYLIADIKQENGADFAAKHNVPHVTLVLFDGAGGATQVLSGMRYVDELRPLLAGHFETHGIKS
ncbi:hypothetical protein C1J03_16810 [Sulfitobacter sp. SK012]|uniref:hypothetical protein n=1 Tax=Sulfitobacter sp. SK012 TaxID=1389005 RepID=UPI000E0BB740|nr:hypothetical protein [Sulfitobacter sp. SK012]AXI47519.1 hypothetical protein C1J03_16810 [Sulfitobacter sp. SK012]